jgi:hypothetical protein
MTPRVLLIDLHELPNPRETLDDVRFVLPPERVLVVTALGSLRVEEVRERGFNVIERPATIGQIVAATGVLLSRNTLGTERTRLVVAKPVDSRGVALPGQEYEEHHAGEEQNESQHEG